MIEEVGLNVRSERTWRNEGDAAGLRSQCLRAGVGVLAKQDPAALVDVVFTGPCARVLGTILGDFCVEKCEDEKVL